MIYPKHIERIAKGMELEYRNLEENEQDVLKRKKYYSFLKLVRELREAIEQQEPYGTCTAHDDDEIMQYLYIAKEIDYLASELSVSVKQKIFYETDVETELVFVLNHSWNRHPRMREEIKAVADLISSPPGASWGQEDMHEELKRFRLVKNQRKFLRFMETEEGTYLTENFKHVKMFYVKTDSSENRIVEDAKKHLIEKMGSSEFFSSTWNKAFNLWFQIQSEGTYYIYVPK